MSLFSSYKTAFFPALLLFTSVVLRDDTNQIPAGSWRYDRFFTKAQLPVKVECRFRARRGDRVRVELVTEENLSALMRRQAYESIASSGSPRREGNFDYQIGVPGSFAMVVLNESDAVAEVSLRLSLDTEPELPGFTRTVPPRRKTIIFILSFTGFFAIVAFSAAKLLSAIRAARREENALQEGPPHSGT